MRFILLAGMAILVHFGAMAQKKPPVRDGRELLSPDKKIRLMVETVDLLSFAIEKEGQLLLRSSVIDLQTSAGTLGGLRVGKSTITHHNSVIQSPVPEKRIRIPDQYTQLLLQYDRLFTVEFRVYNDGVAYRLLTTHKDSLTIYKETAEYGIMPDHMIYFSPVAKRTDADIYHTSFEEPYQIKQADSIPESDLIFSPLLVDYHSRGKLVLTESDLEDYPGMFLRCKPGGRLTGEFAGYPLEEQVMGGEFKQAVVTRRAGYIAKTKGTRSFPWRVFMMASEDRQLPENDLVYRLASPSRVPDPSWISPGKGTDEWIIGINLFNVPFKSGVNTATYKYYIDFASRFGFDRIMMDAGWSDYNDLFKINPAINMDEIAAYAREKKIRLSMWTLALTLKRQLKPALEQFKKWGVDFIMTDFMDRDDQEMVRFYFDIAEACAANRMMIMYHGAFKPAGFGRTYPNAITRESVLGSEYNIWSDKPTPEHNLMLPFIRMTAGPMDYEPGILDNATRQTFRPISEKVMSTGTRCHQAAMFVVYESPIQLFSGNPSQGLMEPAFMELLGSVPTTWDTTQVLDGRIGDYIITARKRGDTWFLGAMTDWTSRSLEIPLHFLEPGNYEMTICEDGINADRYPSDYTIKTIVVNASQQLTIRMAAGGGYLARLRKL